GTDVEDDERESLDFFIHPLVLEQVSALRVVRERHSREVNC
ncbi:MAG: hypothetical protein JWR11_4119, partial [Mycobacterium sp.]|nr:hypothetical protein [Mycobacterium sp.]